MRCAVVIVNWRGAADTLACLASFVGAAGAVAAFDAVDAHGAHDAEASADAAGAADRIDFVPVVVDNGSDDGSLPRIAAALRDAGRAPWCGPAASLARAPADATALLLDAGENLGFAAGANLGLRAAVQAGCEFTVFLNNDTLVEAGALPLLVQRLQHDASLYACLPMLTLYGSDRIWNCGGRVSPLGLRRYHLAGRPRAEGAARAEIDCSFFTGCCFAVRSADFAARGGFSTRFFFGEEDFELALWMRERGLRALCLTAAVVQHKVSASFSAAAGPRQNARVFIYYLNRFIHMRLRLGSARWALWLAAYLPYVAWLLRRQGLGAAEVLRFLRRVVGLARRLDGVGRSDFEAVMAGRIAW